MSANTWLRFLKKRKIKRNGKKITRNKQHTQQLAYVLLRHNCTREEMGQKKLMGVSMCELRVYFSFLFFFLFFSFFFNCDFCYLKT